GCKLPVAETGGHCFATVLYNENTYRSVWRRRRAALSDAAQWVCGSKSSGKITGPPEPDHQCPARARGPHCFMDAHEYRCGRSDRAGTRLGIPARCAHDPSWDDPSWDGLLSCALNE